MSELPEKSYARSLGAKCDECPLRAQPTYVCDTTVRRGNQRLVLYGDAPTVTECDTKSTFLGAKKYYLKRACDASNIHFSDIFPTYTLGCALPKHTKPKDLQKAVECCAPLRRHLLQSEGAQTQNTAPIILTMGSIPLSVFTGKTSATSWRGYHLEGVGEWEGYTVFPTISYASILAEPAMELILHEDFRRIRGLFSGAQDYIWPKTHIDGAVLLVGDVQPHGKTIAVDIETNSLNHLDAEITCIGIGFEDECYSIKFPFVDGRVEDWVVALLQDDKTEKVYHNALYDIPILEKHGLHIKGKIHDTLILHHTLFPTLPHDLGFVGSQLFNAPRWKSLTQNSFAEHQVYNARDAFYTLQAFNALSKQLLVSYKGQELYEAQLQLLPIAIGMQTKGVKIDQDAMAAHRRALSLLAEKAAQSYGTNLQTVGLDSATYQLGKNGATAAVKKLFFETLKVPVYATTETGLPKLDEAVLQKLIADGPTPISRTIAKAVLDYRKPNKLISTYIDGLPVHKGRVHPTWKTTGTITGRWASSEPNMQNLPKQMRDIFVPAEGNVIASADYSALELRLIALLASDEPLLNAFNSGADVHRTNASLMFKKAITDVTDAERNLTKTFTYLCVPTHTRTLCKTKGWVGYNNLDVGDLILGYNMETKQKEWTPVLEKFYKPDQELLEINSGKGFRFQCTPDHRWVVCKRGWQRPSYYSDEFLESTENLNSEHCITVNAPMTPDVGSYNIDMSCKYGPNWDMEILHMSSTERRAWLNGFMLADGHYHKEGNYWVWCQLPNGIKDAALTCSFLVHNGCLWAATSLNGGVLHVRLGRRGTVTGQRLKKVKIPNADVWCVRTALNTWVIRQNDCISITGNCIYGGGAEKLRESLIEKGYVFSVQETQALLAKFYEAHPALKVYQRKLLAIAYEQHYVEEPWSGRRQYFYGGKVNPNKVLNYPCQAAAATMMNAAVVKMNKMFTGSEKLLAQVHDAAYIEGPDPARLKTILTESMTTRLHLNSHTLDFPVDFGYGPNMRDTKLK